MAGPFYTTSIGFPGLTSKTTPVGADLFMLADSAANFEPKQALLSAFPGSAPAYVNSTSATQAMAINTIYQASYTGGSQVFTLPAAASSPLGTLVGVQSGPASTAGFAIDQNASQTIASFNNITTAGVTGSITLVPTFGYVLLRCTDVSGTGLTWVMVDFDGVFLGA